MILALLDDSELFSFIVIKPLILFVNSFFMFIFYLSLFKNQDKRAFAVKNILFIKYQKSIFLLIFLTTESLVFIVEFIYLHNQNNPYISLFKVGVLASKLYIVKGVSISKNKLIIFIFSSFCIGSEMIIFSNLIHFSQREILILVMKYLLIVFNLFCYQAIKGKNIILNKHGKLFSLLLFNEIFTNNGKPLFILKKKNSSIKLEMINENALSIFGLKSGNKHNYKALDQNFKLKFDGFSQNNDFSSFHQEKKGKEDYSKRSEKIYRNTEQNFIETEKIENECMNNDSININDLIKNFNAKDTTKKIEISLKNENGIPIFFTFEILKTKNESKIYFIFLIHEQAKKEEIPKFKSSNQFDDQLINLLSHEIKIYINGALPNLELLKNSIEDEKLLKYLEIPIGSLKLLQNHLDNFFCFNLLKNDQIYLNKNEFDLSDIIKEISKIVTPMIKMRNLNFILDVPNSEKIHITTDYLKLKQVLLNLLINAIQFTYSGDIILKMNMVGEKAFKFLIQDTGIGINKLELNTIKKKIKTANYDILEISSVDNGMGLLVCEKLLVLLGSEDGIEIESKINEGSQFFFVIFSKDRYFNILDEEISKKYDASLSKISQIKSNLLCSFNARTNSSFIEEQKQLKIREQQLKNSNSGLEDLQPTFSKFNSVSNISSKNLKEERFKLKYNFEPLIKLLDNFIEPKQQGINHKHSSDTYLERIAFDNFNHISFASNTCRNTEKEISKTPSEVSSRFKSKSKRNGSNLNLFKTSSLTVNGQPIKKFICECQEILYIDGNIFNLLSLELVLKCLDLRCCKVVNGFEAIKELKKGYCQDANCKRFKLILMDFKMPIMNSLDTAKKINYWANGEQNHQGNSNDWVHILCFQR